MNSPSCSSVLQEWIHFFPIRLYAGLDIILAKVYVCMLWSFRQKHDKEPIPDSNSCQVTQPCMDLVFMIREWPEQEKHPMRSDPISIWHCALLQQWQKDRVFRENTWAWALSVSILLSIQNIFIMNVHGYIPIQSFEYFQSCFIRCILILVLCIILCFHPICQFKF